jgi:RNA polymerase sigma-70 factor (ECF subfamily)
MLALVIGRPGDSTRDIEEVRLFGELFEANARAIYNFCFRRTADWALAEDLMSVVFLEAWRRRRGAPLTGESARPWLLGVAVNVIRNHRRSLRRYQKALGRMPAPAPVRDFAGEVDQRLDDERQAGRLRELIRGLSQRDQEVLALCVGDELSYDEAALALGVPIGTVRSRLSRARAHVRSVAAVAGSVTSTASDQSPSGRTDDNA